MIRIFIKTVIKMCFIYPLNSVVLIFLECDQKILSKRGSTGMVFSPNYPYPYHPNVVCRYYVYGMQDAQRLERVKVQFEKFEIPTNKNS